MEKWQTACLSSRRLAHYSTDRYVGGLYFRVRNGTGCYTAALAVLPKLRISTNYIILSINQFSGSDQMHDFDENRPDLTVSEPSMSTRPCSGTAGRCMNLRIARTDGSFGASWCYIRQGDSGAVNEMAEVNPADTSGSVQAETKKRNDSYFVSPHQDGGWQVKRTGAQKALKKFKTKAEAEAYAKEVASNQGISVVRQKKDGKIQKKR